MRFLVSVVFLVCLLVSGLGIPSPTLAAECSFVLGFKTLHDLAPDVVGDCVVDQRYNPLNGDSLQEATRGLLVWRKADNFTAFTDGYRTWVNGPFGVEQRLNSERFQWEAVQQLRNAEFLLTLTDPQDRLEKETPIRLVDGEYNLQSDSPPQRLRVGLIGDFVATGDLNGDGVPDAVAPLSVNTGGTGTFIFIAAMIDRNGALVQAGREFLGDRVRLNSIAIAGDGTTTVDMIVHGPNDPACCPTQRTVTQFQAAGLLAGGNTASSPLNATYLINEEPFTLTNGSAEKEIAPGSATKNKVSVFGAPALGDIDGDGDDDAVLILVNTPGGSGTFYYAAIAVNVNGGYKGTDTILLGDRIAPQTYYVQGNRAIVNYADRAPGEAFSVRPSIGKSLFLQFDSESLRLIKVGG